MKPLVKLLFFMAVTTATQTALAGNPFFSEYKTVHQTIPFDQIKNEHYMPAFQEAMKVHTDEINKIINQKAAPTFKNTLEALENSGELLSKVASPFYNLLSSETSDELQKIAEEISPLLTEHSNSVTLNEKLFERIKVVYDQKENLNLTTEQAMLLQKTYDSFANNGANLSAEDKEKYRELTKKLSLLTLQFGQNALKELNAYELLVSDKNLLDGIPEDVLEMFAKNAEKKGKTGWLLDLKVTSLVPLLKYANNRDLRREIYYANATRNLSGGDFDNKQNIIEIVNTRLEIANLLGHNNYADYVLIRRMAENKENVYKLLNDLLEAYKPTAEKEVQAVQEYADSKGAYFKIQPWDWSYYSEKLKSDKYAINDEVLKPYFELENVKKGVFGLATQLYGITFVKNEKVPVYNQEVDVYDVVDKNGNFLSVLYTDFHPRDGKRAGAWMNEFKGQKVVKGADSRPQITIVMNFTRPTATKPALLTFDEFTTFLHEFGHALHGMMTKCTYESLSGTSVYRDFVELPSQFMENYATQKEFLDQFAVHYETGEKIPAELIQKIQDAENFNAAYFCIRQLSFGLLDMAWHTQATKFDGDVIEFEKKAMASTQILPSIPGVAMGPTFSHIFAGGYAAGYYGYKWAEVLDADAFSVFAKNGIFDPKTAQSFLQNILEKGGTEHPMTLYKNFRGQEPTIDALLKRNGIL